MLSILIPAFNEESTIHNSVLEVLSAVNTLSIDYELILIDDGSADSTYDIMLYIYKNYENIKLIRNDKNIGLSSIYKLALENASGEYFTWVPSDLSHNAQSLINVYKLIGVSDILLPIPINPNVRNLFRRIISNIYIYLINIISGNKIAYYNGLSVHKTSLLKSITIIDTGFGFQAEIICKLLRNGCTYTVVPTKIEERSDGKSKAISIKNILSIFKMLTVLR